MRLSAHSGDPGYRPFRLAMKHGAIAVVTVNGVWQKDVILADTKRGFAVVHMRDEQGKLVVNRKKALVCVRRIYGKVEITMQRMSQCHKDL